jgi:hypothetical protein
MEGLLCPLGLEYQMSSNLGAIAIQNFAQHTLKEEKDGGDRRIFASLFIFRKKGVVLRE